MADLREYKPRQATETWQEFLARSAPTTLSGILMALSAIPATRMPITRGPGVDLTPGDFARAASVERQLPTKPSWDVVYNRRGEAVRNPSPDPERGDWMHQVEYPVDPGITYGLPLERSQQIYPMTEIGTSSAAEAAGNTKGMRSAPSIAPLSYEEAVARQLLMRRAANTNE